MSALQALFLLPAALILDLLFSEPPARVHPVCDMGYLASRAEPFFRRLLSCPFPPDTEGGSPLREGLAGLLAGLAVILPPAVIAWSLTALAGYSGTAGGFAMAAVSVWLCLAPVSLARHALRVRGAAEAGKTGEARKAVSMIVGRDTSLLDMHGVCRACVESVAENLTDGVLCTLFWAMAGRRLPYGMALPARPREPQQRVERGALRRGPRAQAGRPGCLRRNEAGSSLARHGHTGRGIRPYLPGRPAHVGLSHHFYPGLVSRPGRIQLKKNAAAVSTSENSGRVTSVRRADYFRLSTISFEIWKLWASSGKVPAFTSPQ